MKEEGFSFAALSSRDRVVFAPILIALLQMLVNRGGEEQYGAKFSLVREGESIEVGLGGQSGFGDLRTLNHEELMAFWETVGADKAPHVYQELLKCEKVMTFKLLTFDRERVLSKSERARTLNMQELLLSWGLGTNQRQQKLPDARAARGLPWLPKMLGLNIDPCTKRPSQDALAQKFGPTDRGYLYLRSQECRLWSKLHLARAAASDAPDDDELQRQSASAHLAYERARQERDAKFSLLITAGEHNHLLDFKNRITPRVCGAAVMDGELDVRRRGRSRQGASPHFSSVSGNGLPPCRLRRLAR